MVDFFTSCYSSQNQRNIQNMQLHHLLRKTFPEFFKSDYDVINDNDSETMNGEIKLLRLLNFLISICFQLIKLFNFGYYDY